MALNGFGLYRQTTGALVRIESLIATRLALTAFLEDARPDDASTVAIVILGDV